MTFPKPSGFDADKFKSEDETEPEREPVNSEPTFPDDLSRTELKHAIRKYQDWCNDHYDELDVDLDEVPVELSDKMKRTAGKVGHYRGSRNVEYIRYAYKAYQKWGWEKFAETVRHELIHVHTVQNYGEGGHGTSFKVLTDPLETHRHCESFARDEAKFILYCKECGNEVDQKFRKSKTVKQPEKYISKCCKAPLRVEDNR